MTAAGEQVLAVVRGEVGTQSGSKYWQWYGADYGSYCACFVSWGYTTAGFPLCAIDSAKGFILVSNGTYHSYVGGEIVPDFEPGDVVLFSWYSWTIVDGMPVITDPEWYGWIAGDHTGVFSHWIDRSSGRFAAVEGNTNGGVVAERTDRYAYQVCGYWRPPIISGGGGSLPVPPSYEDDDDMYQPLLVITEGSPWKGSVFLCAGGFAVGINDASILGNMQSRGYCKPTIEVNDWDVYGAYQVVYASGPGAVPRS